MRRSRTWHTTCTGRLSELLDLEHADRRRYVGMIQSLAARGRSEK